MAIKREVEIEVKSTGVKEAFKEIKDLFKSYRDGSAEALKSQSKLNDEIENTGKAAGKSKKGLRGMSKGLKAIGTAFVASGIGIFVILLSRLAMVFKENEKVSKALGLGMEYVTNVVGEVVDVIDSVVTSVADSTNGFESLGKVLGGAVTLVLNNLKLSFYGIKLGIQNAQLIWEKSFLGGNDAETIKGLTKDISETSAEIGTLVKSSIDAGKSIITNFKGAVGEISQVVTKSAEALSKLELDSTILRAKSKAKESKADIARAKETAAKEKEIKDQAIQDEKNRLDSIKEIKDGFDSSLKDQEAKTHEEKLELQRTRAQEELDLLIGTEEEKRAAQLSLDALYDAKEKELKDKKAEDQKIADGIAKEKEITNGIDSIVNQEFNYKSRKDLLDTQRAEILADDTLTEEQKTKVLKENTEARDEIDKQRGAGLKKGAAAAASALGTASELLGKSTAGGKAAAIAATTFDTLQSGVSAFKGMVKAIPGPAGIAAGSVAAAGAVASGFASVKKILAVKTPGGGGGGGGGLPSAPAAPAAPAFNLVGTSGVNQISDSLQEEQTPIKAFVVGADVTSQQELDSNQQASASIG